MSNEIGKGRRRNSRGRSRKKGGISKEGKTKKGDERGGKGRSKKGGID